MSFLFVDRILQRDSRHISGLKHITPDDIFLYQTEEDPRYCFMPSLIGETIGQLAAWLVMEQKHFYLRPVAGVVAQALMFKNAYVGETLHLSAEIDAIDDVAVQYHGHATVNGEKVFSVEGAIGPMLPMQDFIDEERVKQQFKAIDRLGDEPLSTYPEIGHLRPTSFLSAIQFDSLFNLVPQQSCRAFKKISKTAVYFPDHFPNKPVLPLTILLECKRRLAADFLQASCWSTSYRLQSMERIKMSDFVQPGDVIETELLVKKQSENQLILHLRSFVEKKRVCVVDLVFEAEV